MSNLQLAKVAAQTGLSYPVYKTLAAARKNIPGLLRTVHGYPGLYPHITSAVRSAMAYRRRSASRRAGRMAVRARKRASNRAHKRTVRQKIGEPVGQNNAKRVALRREVCSPIDTNNLYEINLSELGVRGDGINQRERGLVNIRGWKIKGEFKNNFESPLYLNIAIIAKKNENGQPNVSNFFRDDNTSRATNFNSTVSSLHKHHALINTDLWNVMMHRRYRLAGERDSSPGNSVQYSSGRASYMNFSRWVPFKRQLRFDANTDTRSSTADILLVYWCSTFCGSGSVVSTGAMDHNFDIVCYFRDTKC